MVACSNNIYMLYNLLVLALNYCKKYSVDLCADKTKLLLFADRIEQKIVPLNPIMINQEQIDFSEQAEHVGVVRSTNGNLANLLNRIVCSKKATNGALANGLAKGHRSNPAACLHVLQLYGTPVLMSGLASLVLNPAEISLIHQHHKNTLQSLQKLHPGTPQSFIFFMGGCLPATALLHIRQFTNFGMICRMPDDPLHSHARHVLITAKQNCSSWFTQIKNLCLQYGLPHPLTFLDTPLPKLKFKKIIKSKVVDYWEQKLRTEASPLTSLSYFKPEYMSLCRPHPIWCTAGSNPYEISKAVVQSKMLSGRYRTRQLSSNWSESGDSRCPSSSCTAEVESLEHLLLHCPAYSITRSNVVKKWKSSENPVIAQLANNALELSSKYLMQIILDATVLTDVVSAVKASGFEILSPLLNLTRTWCYSIHTERLKLLGLWKFS